MKSFEEHIRELCALEGISGREDAVRGYLIDELKASPADMEWETDALGNLLVQVKGKHRAGCRLLFAAHMDEVGMLVTGATQEGYLRVTAVGGIDPRILFGKRVRVNGRPGVIGGKAVHHCTSEEKTAAPSLDEIRVDILASGREQALEWAPPGSPVVWDSVYTPLSGWVFQGPCPGRSCRLRPAAGIGAGYTGKGIFAGLYRSGGNRACGGPKPLPLPWNPTWRWWWMLPRHRILSECRRTSRSAGRGEDRWFPLWMDAPCTIGRCMS